MSSDNKIAEILSKKRREDPKGFEEAEKKGELLHYLSRELKEAGIDKSSVSHLQKKKPVDSAAASNANMANIIDTVSEALDDIVFSNLYKKGNSEIEGILASKITNYKSMKALNERLKTPKVVLACAGFLLGLISFSKFSKGSSFSGLVLGIVSADLLRMANNCYIRTYCGKAGKRLFGDMKRLGTTFMSWAGAAIGLTDEKDDPIRILQEEIVWEAVLDGTVTELVIKQLKSASKSKSS